MNTLAVDTSFSSLTVALQTDTAFELHTIKNISSQHSERIMPEIISVCKEAGISLNDIDLLACTRGPGSFTGLRIGMSCLKGLAYGLDKPLVSVSTLEVFAHTCLGQTESTIVSVLDAKKQRWYLAAFKPVESGLKRIMPDTDGTETDLDSALESSSSVFVTGPDCEPFCKILAQRYKDKAVSQDNWNEKTIAHSLIELAKEQLLKKGADDIGQGPAYLRKSDAEIALEEKKNKTE